MSTERYKNVHLGNREEIMQELVIEANKKFGHMVNGIIIDDIEIDHIQEHEFADKTGNKFKVSVSCLLDTKDNKLVDSGFEVVYRWKGINRATIKRYSITEFYNDFFNYVKGYEVGSYLNGDIINRLEDVDRSKFYIIQLSVNNKYLNSMGAVDKEKLYTIPQFRGLREATTNQEKLNLARYELEKILETKDKELLKKAYTYIHNFENSDVVQYLTESGFKAVGLPIRNLSNGSDKLLGSVKIVDDKLLLITSVGIVVVDKVNKVTVYNLLKIDLVSKKAIISAMYPRNNRYDYAIITNYFGIYTSRVKLQPKSNFLN